MSSSKRLLANFHRSVAREHAVCYDFKPLKEGSIRLLELLPGNDDDELRCSLITVPLGTSPKYEAMSYCWGDAEPAAYVGCESGHVRITENLASGLRQIRRPDDTRFLWADQICVDQGNIPERSAQVNIMHRIFKQAVRVVVWLGPDDETNPQAPLAVEFARNLASLPQWKRLRPLAMEDFEHEAVRYGLPPLHFPAWTAFWAFLTLPYFSRVWIVQELALASERIIQWGSTIVELRDVSKLRSNLGSIPPILFLHNNAIQITELNLAIRNFNTSLAMLVHDSAPSLLHLASKMVRRSTKDPRDLIFALLGMLDYDLGSVTADYAKNLVQTYELATRLFLKEAPGRLDFLSFAGTQLLSTDAAEETADWPSWIPNWTVNRLPRIELHRPLFNANATEPHNVVQYDWLKFCVDGIYIGELSQILPLDPLEDIVQQGTIYERLIAAHDLYKIFKHGSKALGLTSIIDTFLRGSYTEIKVTHFGYSRSVVRHDAYKDFAALALDVAVADLRDGALQTLRDLEDRLKIVEDVYTAKWPSESDRLVMSGFQTFLHKDASTPGVADIKLLYEHESGAALPLADKTIEKAAKIVETLDWTDEEKFTGFRLILNSFNMYGDKDRLVNIIVRSACDSRCFFITKRGSMGMGPPAVLPGDFVVILFGANTPFVLRPTVTTGAYRLIGQCYLNGVMHGEHIERLKAGGKFQKSRRTFTLI